MMKKTKMNNTNYNILTELPRAPKILNEAAKKIYYSKGRRLVFLGALSEFDISMFVSYCMELEIYERTQKQLAKFKDDKPATEYNKILLEQIESKNRRAWDRVKKLSEAFGFTPQSRLSSAKKTIRNSFEEQFGRRLKK